MKGFATVLLIVCLFDCCLGEVLLSFSCRFIFAIWFFVTSDLCNWFCKGVLDLFDVSSSLELDFCDSPSLFVFLLLSKSSL